MPYLGAVQLATTTLGSSASSVTFSNIPTKLNGLYLRDLILIYNGANSDSIAGLFYRLNGDTTSGNYTRVVMLATSGGASSNTSPGNALSFGSTDRTSLVAQFLDYSATDKHKTILTRSGTPNLVEAGAFRWANTNAITSITLFRDGGATINSGSTFSLYATVRKP